MRYKPIEEITWEELLKCDGYSVRYKIKSNISIDIKEGIGKLRIEYGNIYICQNDVNGTNCNDKKGFIYSYILSRQEGSNYYKSCIIEVATSMEVEFPKSNSLMKFKLGKIKFKDDGSVRDFFVEPNIPSKKIIHGNFTLHPDYYNEYAEIVDFHNQYYIVKYKDGYGKYTQLGYLESSLEEVSEKPLIPQIGDWVVITKSTINWARDMDKFDGKCVKIINISDNGDYMHFKGRNDFAYSFRQGHFRKALPHEIPQEEIPQEKFMFKEGDYIVLLDTPSTDSCFPSNFIFKQRVDYNYLKVERDLKGSQNGWHAICDDGEYKWRYATKEEIAEYDRLRRPYDVTTLKNRPFKAGDKIVGLAKSGMSIVDKGMDYCVPDKVEYDKNGYEVLLWNRGSFWGCNLKDISHYIESKKEVDMDAILEEAKRKYPIGTEVSNYNLNCACKFKITTSNFGKDRRQIVYYINPSFSYTIYKDGEWAEIVSSPKSLVKEKWYIKYDDSITENDYNNLISRLKELGYRFQCHCGLEESFNTFRIKKYLRFKEVLDGRGRVTDELAYCLDNNSQGFEKQKYITDFINIPVQEKEPEPISFEDVPEYVEVVNPPTHWCKKGEILQFKKVGDRYQFKYNALLNSSHNNEWDGYGNIYQLEQLYSKFFKKSTREAYEAQFKIPNPKYFAKDPIVQELEDIIRYWIPNVTRYKSAYKDETNAQAICIFTGIGTVEEGRIWDACGIGWLYNNGSFAEKVSDDTIVNEAFKNKVTNPKQKSSFDEKAYLSRPENQIMPIKKVNKQKSTIKFY